MINKLWRRSPWDGNGWDRCIDASLAPGRTAAAASFRRRFWAPLRPFMLVADRITWAIVAGFQVGAFARRARPGPSDIVGLYTDCLRTGAGAAEAWVWRQLADQPHPLPARAAGILLSRLGDPAGHALLADKLAAAQRLTEIGVIFPALRDVIPRGTSPCPDRWPDDCPLFIKPRHGFGGYGTLAVTREGTQWRTGRGQRIETMALVNRLCRLAMDDDLLVQERLTAHPDLADLAATGAAPTLRLTTAMPPGGRPFVHSALLMIAVPDRDPRHFLQGQINVPIDLSRGTLSTGVLFADPHRRLERLPWNGAHLAGRRMPDFQAATAVALKAMAALPPLAVVNWDFIPTADGAIMLEGNTAGNWILTTLAEHCGMAASALAPIIGAWPLRTAHTAAVNPRRAG